MFRVRLVHDDNSETICRDCLDRGTAIWFARQSVCVTDGVVKAEVIDRLKSKVIFSYSVAKLNRDRFENVRLW